MPDRSAQPYCIEPFDAARHDRDGFSCGIAAIDNYFHKTANKLAKADNIRSGGGCGVSAGLTHKRPRRAGSCGRFGDDYFSSSVSTCCMSAKLFTKGPAMRGSLRMAL